MGYFFRRRVKRKKNHGGNLIGANTVHCNGRDSFVGGVRIINRKSKNSIPRGACIKWGGAGGGNSVIACRRHRGGAERMSARRNVGALPDRPGIGFYIARFYKRSH